MLGSLIVSLGLMGQAPPPPRPAARATDARTEAAKLIDKRRAKKGARYVARLDREAREAVAEAKAVEAAKKEYKEMLPYLLENQRQMLQRQTDIERNRALDRMAGAAERSSGYSYPGQSPTVGPYR